MRYILHMRHILTMTLGLSLGLLLDPARASASMAHVVGRSADCIVDQGLGSFDIPLSAGSLTVLDFPGTLHQNAGFGLDTQTDFNIQYGTRTLYIQPVPGKPDATLSMVVSTNEPAMQVRLFFRVTDSPDKALGLCRFVSRDQADRQRWQRAQTIAVIQGRLHGQGELVPQVRGMHATSNKVAVRLGRALYFQGDLWTSFFIESVDWQPLRLANVQLTGRDGTITSLDDVILDPPARPRAQAIAELPVGQRVSGLMRLPGVAEGMEPLEIAFTGFTGARMVVVTAEEPIWVWVPRREDEVREEQRQAAQDAAVRGVTMSLQGIYGAIWLGDGTGADLSDATSMTGLGVRAEYTFNRYWTAEGEVMGASTGTARFEDVTYEGAQGDLARSAALGRAQFGGVLRIGTGSISMPLRLGVGLQGASHDGTLTTATGEAMPGPDPFEWNFLFAFGAGIDVRLGAFRAGIALSGSTPFGDYDLSSRSIEGRIHLGYAWTP